MALERLVSYGVEDLDETTQVVNPAWRQLEPGRREAGGPALPAEAPRRQVGHHEVRILPLGQQAAARSGSSRSRL